MRIAFENKSPLGPGNVQRLDGGNHPPDSVIEQQISRGLIAD